MRLWVFTGLYCTVLYCTALYCTALHCTALHCTALHCTALHCTALHCTALHCTALHCTALHCTALHCTALHCTALHCTALHCTALHCTALHCTALHCTALHCTALHCTALHCTALHCTALHCTALHCTALHCTALQCTALYCTVLYCTVLYCTVLYCTVLYCTVLYCTVLYCTVLYCIDVGKLKDPDTRNQFKGVLQERLLSKPDDNLSVEGHWTHVKTALTDACKKAFGFKTKRHQDWLNENDKYIKRMTESKRQAFSDWQNHRHCNVRKAKCQILRADVQREIRNIKGKWWIDKADEIQGYADNHMSREFYAATRTIYGPTQRHTAPIRSKDGTTIIKEKEGILCR